LEENRYGAFWRWFKTDEEFREYLKKDKELSNYKKENRGKACICGHIGEHHGLRKNGDLQNPFEKRCSYFCHCKKFREKIKCDKAEEKKKELAEIFATEIYRVRYQRPIVANYLMKRFIDNPKFVLESEERRNKVFFCVNEIKKLQYATIEFGFNLMTDEKFERLVETFWKLKDDYVLVDMHRLKIFRKIAEQDKTIGNTQILKWKLKD